MALSKTLLHAALSLALLAACADDDSNMLATDPGTADGAENTDGIPPPDNDPFVIGLDHVAFSTDLNRIELLAYDADDQLLGMFALQYHGSETVQFVADFADGTALVEIEGDTVTSQHSDLPASVIARRAEAVGLAIDSGTNPQEGWLKCAALTAVTVNMCWNPATALWACGASSFVTACECLDQLADKFEWVHDEC